MNIRDWYKRTEAAWPKDVPAVGGDELARAMKKLYRFTFGRKLQATIKVSSGNTIPWERYGELIVNPDKGWKENVHSISHAWWRRQPDYDKPHSKGHARFEAKLIREVLKRGWLSGSLKTAPKPMPAPRPQAELVRELRDHKLAKLDAAEARWAKKLKRATTAIAKIRRQRSASLRAWKKIDSRASLPHPSPQPSA